MTITMPSATTPTGSRRMTLTMMVARDHADSFVGVTPGSAKPLRYLAAFQEAEPYLGLPPQAFKLIAWMVKQTQNVDWEQGSRPICWPSAARQAEFLGLSPARVKVLNRALYEAGVFILRDSDTGKRYGRRGADGRIIEAYGFDLSPLAVRYTEFVRLAADARRERETMRALRKRATISRRAIREIGETLAGSGPLPSPWAAIEHSTADLVALLPRIGRSNELALAVTALESNLAQAEALLRARSNPVNKSPQGLASEPHTISTNATLHQEDTVAASEWSSQARALPKPPTFEREAQEENDTARPAASFETIERMNPAELLELAPRLGSFVPQTYPDWRNIVDAAGGPLRQDLGVSPSLWGEACLVLGREVAAITLAIVSTKPEDYFQRGAGGYFAAMVKRGKSGELRLDRSVWKLRKDKWGGKQRTVGRD